MSDDDTTPDDGDEMAEEFVEIEEDALQAVIAALQESGLDLDDHQTVIDHLGVVLGIYLRKVGADTDAGEEELSEMAANAAGLAVQIAVEDEELPAFD